MEHLNAIKLQGLKNKLDTQLWDACDGDIGSNEDIRNKRFVSRIIVYFHSIFHIGIEDKRYDIDEVCIDGDSDLEPDEPTYELYIFGETFGFYCDSKEQLFKVLTNRANDGDIFHYCPFYIHSFIYDKYKEITTNTKTYPEPDLECDEDIPLYDNDECPCCMEKYGITETTTLVGNHPTKKIIKKTKKLVIKRNTYCGHPLCLECFKTICEGDKICCPTCRVDYEYDLEQGTLALDIEIINKMIEQRDDYLIEICDVNAVVEQALYSDGYDGLLCCEGFVIENDDWFFGLKEYMF
tara:strand:- start:1526 stop:2410 length:885 start_codon:yes stop_codon:yes gene_type:complete